MVGHGNDLTWLNVLQEKSIPRVTGSNGKIASTLGLFYLFILYHICCLPGNAITEKKMCINKPMMSSFLSAGNILIY